MNIDVMNKISYGLFVLTAKDGEKDNGCIINTAMQVTIEPNCISVVVNKSNYTHDIILKNKEFNISILDESSQFATYKNFGFKSGRDSDKLVEVDFARAANGIVYLTKESNGYISGKVIKTVDLGTHTMFIAEVTDGEILSDKSSVTYAYYYSNIKEKDNVAAGKKGFICIVCGFIYEGETLPPDYICPICKHGAADFRPL
ncbi:MAG: flavin reductase [Spirochaetales bacterium]|nr:flavin reductase [Spirochaetales bacterium]MBR2317274.1 flavin reductase [Spirochaetales bacterium]